MRTIISDGSDQMDIIDFADAIPDRMFKYIIFEACHMAGIEVAYQLKDKTQYIIASSAEIVSPGFTAFYENHVIQLLVGNPQGFIQTVFEYYNEQEGWKQSATFSVIQTDVLSNLADFVKSHCDFSIQNTLDLSTIQHFDRGNGYLFCDFEDFYSRLLATAEEKQQLHTLVLQCVPWKGATEWFMDGYNGFKISVHSGMTAYIQQARYSKLNENYKELEWAK
ncbi:hypothetical protein MASR2M117_08700 [Paludibacter sp.]